MKTTKNKKYIDFAKKHGYSSIIGIKMLEDFKGCIGEEVVLFGVISEPNFIDSIVRGIEKKSKWLKESELYSYKGYRFSTDCEIRDFIIKNQSEHMYKGTLDEHIKFVVGTK